jgi:hypothetical protein
MSAPDPVPPSTLHDGADGSDTAPLPPARVVATGCVLGGVTIAVIGGLMRQVGGRYHGTFAQLLGLALVALGLMLMLVGITAFGTSLGVRMARESAEGTPSRT